MRLANIKGTRLRLGPRNSRRSGPARFLCLGSRVKFCATRSRRENSTGRAVAVNGEREALGGGVPDTSGAMPGRCFTCPTGLFAPRQSELKFPHTSAKRESRQY
jgi:hypothetical protein